MTAILDLTEYGTLSFVKNGSIDFGVAFTGLKEYGNLKFAVSLHCINTEVKCSYQKIQDW